MLLGLAVLAPLVAGLLSLALPRNALLLRTLVAAGGFIAAFAIVLAHVMQAGATAGPTGVLPWIPSLNLNFAFLADGLGAFFALLVSGVGLMIVLYARAYFGREALDEIRRFYPTLGFFATAMLGVVLADYTLLTLLFWEMTSISSFLLIGWDRYDKKAVKLAMQAFFTTGLGGMGLLGGILLLGQTTGIWRWSELTAQAGTLDLALAWTNPLLWAFFLMFIGAATKSAQFPWHYWLPGAMAAPTPVSAYLHAATMVKAGVYLIGRLLPVFAALELWPWLIIPIGAITMLLGAALALNQHDLKRIFAYTTVSQLGLLMAMYGLGALTFMDHGHAYAAIDWDITQIANHAFYKAPLFMIAGALGHVASRQLPELFGAWRDHKAMVLVMLLAGWALAALPGSISFQAKELFLYAIYHLTDVHPIFWVLLVMVILQAMFNVAIFVRLATTLLGLPTGLRAQRAEVHVPHAHHGEPPHDPAEHHTEHGLWGVMLWLPALIIVVPQFIGGIYPPLWEQVFLPLETNVNYFGQVEAHLPVLWHLHAGVPLYASALAVVLGLMLGLSPIMRGAVVDVFDRVYPAMYWLAVTGGRGAFGLVQTGNLRHYLVMVLAAFLIAFVGTLFVEPGVLNVLTQQLPSVLEFWPGFLMGIIVCATAAALPLTEDRVLRVVLLGACGFSVVGMYLVYQAPDLALTQLMFELISVILFVLVLRLLPEPTPAPAPLMNRVSRLALSVAVGLVFGWMTLVAATTERAPLLGEWFAQHSYQGTEATDGRGGGGDNVVNVILVDFRGFDTLGEITVLALAAMGVWSILPASARNRFRRTQGGDQA